MKDYKVDEVIRALTKKGCVITLDQPITRTIDDVEYTSKGEIEDKFTDFLLKNTEQVVADTLSLGTEKANQKWFDSFKKKNKSLFTPKSVRRTITVQSPYVVNIEHAFELGNGSWGKIDFLTNHQGFSVMK